MKTTFLSIVMVLLFLCAAAQDKKITKSFSNVKTIQMKTSSGDVNIRKSADSQVKLELSYTYDEDEYTPQMDINGGKLTLNEDFTRGSHSGSSVWNLEVPNNLTISINSGSGEITVEDVTADIRTNLGSGDVTVNALKGVVNVNTGSGNIEITKSDGDVSLNTGSGNLRVKDGSGDLSLNAGSGTITLETLKGTISANTGSGNIRAKALTLTGKGKFNTGSGDASVTLASALDYDISVNSGSGDATLNFNGNEISGEVVMTANKRNGNIVAPFKFDKEETIDDNGSSERIQKTAKIGNKNIRIKVGTGTGTAEITK
jgi:hypothetical protein